MTCCSFCSICYKFPLQEISQKTEGSLSLKLQFPRCSIYGFQNEKCLTSSAKVAIIPYLKSGHKHFRQPLLSSKSIDRKEIKKPRTKEHHLWKKRDSAGSGHKALNLIRIISELPNEKEAVYQALNKWIAWETEFPLIAAAKALRILRKRSQWLHVIQVAKWMLSKGQGATMGTYDTLLLAFDMDQRVDEAESLWNMILHTHTRSTSKHLFSRMISLYDHHNMQDKIVEVWKILDRKRRDTVKRERNTKGIGIHPKGKGKKKEKDQLFSQKNTLKILFPLPVFADMEELGVRPDEDTVRRVARAFRDLGQEKRQKLVLRRYLCKWKYIHFNGERVRVRREFSEEENESFAS